METKSITSSVTATPMLDEATMSMNVSPNSKKGASQGPDFAAALFTSLARVIPGTEARTAQAASDGLTLAPDEAVKSSSYTAGRSPESVAGAQPAEQGSSAPAKKLVKRADDLREDPRPAALASAASQTIVVPDTDQIAIVRNAPILKSSEQPEEGAASELRSTPTSAELVQPSLETTVANFPFEALLAQTKDSGDPRNISTATETVDTSSPKNTNLPIAVEPAKIGALQEGRSDGPTKPPVIATSNVLDAAAPMAGGLQARTLPVQRIHQDTNSAPSQGSAAPRALQSTLGGTAVAPPTSTSSLMAATGNSPQTNSGSKDDVNGSLPHAQTGPLNAPATTQSSDTRSTPTLLASPNPQISFANQNSAEVQPMSAIATSSSLPIIAIHAQSWVAANLQSVPLFKLETSSDAENTGRFEQHGSTEANDISPTIEAAAIGAEVISRKDGGDSTVNRYQDSAKDRSAGLPSSSLPEPVNGEQSKPESAASPSVPQKPQADTTAVPARAVISDDRSTPANLIVLSVPISKDGKSSNETKSSTGDDQTETTYSETEEDLQEAGGKTPAGHAPNFATDRRAANSATSLSETVGAEQPKVQLTPSASAPQSAQADAGSIPVEKAVSGAGNAPANPSAQISKDAAQSHGAISPNGDDPQHAVLVQSSHLTSQIGKADVKIALQGEQFGMVEFRAKVAGDQVSASITVEHHETHALLSSDLPALHQLLADRQVRVSEILLLHDSLSGGSSHDGAPAKRDESSSRQTGGPSVKGSEESPLPAGTSSSRTGPNAIFDSRGRLSVRA